MNIINFLEKNKHRVGLSGWKILLATEPSSSNTDFAEVAPDIYEKTLKIQVTNRFLNSSNKEQKNILIHELVHARICIFNQMVREHTAILEEHMVNDITQLSHRF